MGIVNMPRKTWMIAVVYPSGDVAYLRHGPIAGSGQIVRFHSKATADVNCEIVVNGLEAGTTAHVERYRASAERE